MPKYSPQTKLIKDMQFVEALHETGSPKEAAKVVGSIGSQGAMNPEESARVMGSKRLRNVSYYLLRSMYDTGVTDQYIAQKVLELLTSDDLRMVDKGITQFIKITERFRDLPEESKTQVSNPKIQKAVDEFEDNLRNIFAS